MGYNTANTEWSSIQSIPNDTKTLINSYFNLLDTNSPHVGDQLASEIFTPDAVIHAGPAGAPAIRGSEGTALFPLPKKLNRVKGFLDNGFLFSF
jgi:hypothetical protein